MLRWQDNEKGEVRRTPRDRQSSPPWDDASGCDVVPPADTLCREGEAGGWDYGVPGVRVPGSDSIVDGIMDVPGTIAGSHDDSYIGVQGGAQGSHWSPRFRRHQLDGPLQPL